MRKLTVEEYVQVLEKMKKSPRDRLGILGELGVGGGGIAAGAALSGTIASAAGAATIAGSTTLGTWLGGILVTSTPVGWVVGSAIAGGALAYVALRLVRSGTKSDLRRNQSIREIERRIAQMRQEVQSSSNYEEKMPNLITGIQYLVVNRHLTQEKATELLGAVERKLMTVEDAFELIQDLVRERQ